jgi:hypothetical protein
MQGSIPTINDREFEELSMVFSGEVGASLLEFDREEAESDFIDDCELAWLLRLFTSSLARRTILTRGDCGGVMTGRGFGEGRGLPIVCFPI